MKSKQQLAEETKDWDAFTIDVDGTIEKVNPSNDRSFDLQELYKHTNCDCVEMQGIYSQPNRVVWCGENGIMNNKPVNKQATIYLHGDLLMPPGGMLGKVLICDYEMVD